MLCTVLLTGKINFDSFQSTLTIYIRFIEKERRISFYLKKEKSKNKPDFQIQFCIFQRTRVQTRCQKPLLQSRFCHASQWVGSRPGQLAWCAPTVCGAGGDVCAPWDQDCPVAWNHRDEASGRVGAPLVMAGLAQSAHYLQVNIAGYRFLTMSIDQFIFWPSSIHLCFCKYLQITLWGPFLSEVKLSNLIHDDFLIT